MPRTYRDAIAALNSLQSNFQTIDAIRKSGRAMNQDAIPEMVEWVHTLGYKPSDLNRLRIIHVAGTKGKGSTSAFISSILSQYGLSKIGLYTSPHLRFVRERIQINNKPLDENQFARYFFETWDRLEGTRPRPVYFRFLTLMAFHAYMSEGVDTAVIECGIGGEYDSTNIITKPSVTAITSLGIDHTAVLGNTIEEIAWHKAGIMKSGAPCFSAPQPAPALKVLEERAAAIPTSLHVVENTKWPLGLSGEHQKINAGVAVAVARSHLEAVGHTFDSAKFRRGLAEVQWPGRCEIRNEADLQWHIDSGHTHESMQIAGNWFNQTASSERRVLLFNQQTRDACALLRTLLTAQIDFSHAVFCANTTFKASGFVPDLQNINVDDDDMRTLKVQKSLAQEMQRIQPQCQVVVRRSIEEAVSWCRGLAPGERSQILVTGSVHLVGGLLEVLES